MPDLHFYTIQNKSGIFINKYDYNRLHYTIFRASTHKVNCSSVTNPESIAA
jgi:hypothetical protein